MLISVASFAHGSEVCYQWKPKSKCKPLGLILIEIYYGKMIRIHDFFLSADYYEDAYYILDCSGGFLSIKPCYILGTDYEYSRYRCTAGAMVRIIISHITGDGQLHACS